MKKTTWAIRTIAVALLPALSLSVTALELQTRNGAAWVSGGVGEDERTEMLIALPDYNLKVRTADRQGDYLAGVRAELRDARGVGVLETVLDGPILLARVPAGRYELRVTYAEVTQSRKLTIPKTGRREVVLYWDVSEQPGACYSADERIFFSDIPCRQQAAICLSKESGSQR